ncbi:LptF/LptG family permease [uncultured Treponema sp.]|uniref:LptF/LptG family permease n=1 Tax=uncultured Treponema sp. TaxID=162155 RepID=UPI0025D1EF50|nr:LptF/LptG family permease [uncultured Treponema sp.]
MASPIWRLKRFLNGKITELLKKFRKTKAYLPIKRVLVSIIYYRRTWARSKAKKNLEEFGKILVQKYNDFNFLNFLSKSFSKAAKLFHLKRLSSFWETAMQEENGVNRHVLFRYLMKELFLYFFIAFIFFFMVFFVNQILLVAENILKKRVPVIDVMRLITYSLPMVIAQSAPFATLVGFLMCLGRLASENEILILRASGQNYRVILKPVLILGILISIASFFVNDYLLPLGTINYNKLYRSILTSNPAVELESNSIKRTNDKTLVIGEVEGENVSDLIFFDTDSDGGQRIIVADASVVKKSSAAGVLMKLIMNDASVVMFDRDKKNDYDVLTSENVELNIFESTFLENDRAISPREMTSYDLYKQIKAMKYDADVTQKKRNRYNLEMAKKFSMPFGSIFFAFFAMPFALIFGKHNGQTIGLIIGLFIALLYWAMSIVGQIFSSRTGVYGVSTMWLPNLLIGLVGLIAYFRLLRK